MVDLRNPLETLESKSLPGGPIRNGQQPFARRLVSEFNDASWSPGTLLTVREVARALRVATSTVYKLCAERRLAHVRVSNAIRVPAAEVERYATCAPS